MRTRIGRLLAVACALWLGLPPERAEATDIPVDLELALAIDVSGSVDREETKLQRDGYVAAFRDPRVIQAIRNGPIGRIAVTYYEWAGFGHMRPVLPWTLVDSAAAAHGVADALTRNFPQRARRTAIAAAIEFGAASFDGNGFEGRRRVIDISGDGPNNWGERVTEARDRAIRRGVVINGLPILDEQSSFGGLPPTPNLDLYYRDCVIGGPGAFVVVAKDFHSFAEAVLRKMILEIADIHPSQPAARTASAGLPRGPSSHRVLEPGRPARFVPAATDGVSPRCDVGELEWRGRWGEGN
jgi:hypothetical protein